MRKSIMLIAAAYALAISFSAHAGEEGMASMPKIRPKRVQTIATEQQAQKIEDQKGFGDKEGSIRMMNLMMVEGSGMEGMDMSKSSHEGH